MKLYGSRATRALTCAVAAFACSSSSSVELPQRTELTFTLRVAEGIDFEREWLTVTFDDGSGPRTVPGSEFEGPLPGTSRTETFVLPPVGQVAIHIEIAQDGVVIGQADRSLVLAENLQQFIRLVLDPSSPVPCHGCTNGEEIPFTGGSLAVATFWVIEITGLIVGGGIT